MKQNEIPRQYLLVLKEKSCIPLKLTIFHIEGKYLKFLKLFGEKKIAFEDVSIFATACLDELKC